MIKNVKCPDCLNESSLPIEPTIHPIKGFYIEVWACKSCGAEMEGKDYMQKLKALGEKNNKITPTELD